MPSTSSRTCTESLSLAARLRLVACGLLMTAVAVCGCWQALADEPAPVRTQMVAISTMKYTPNELHARAGDKIVFQNEDLLPHTVTSKPAGTFDSGMIKAGESWTLTVPAAGTVHFSCLYHPTMEGTLVVENP